MTSSRPRTASPGVPAAGLEGLLEDFEEAWCGGRPPDLDAFLTVAAAGLATDAATRRQLLAELVPLDLEYRWRHADRLDGPPAVAEPDRPLSPSATLPRRPRLEDYVVRFPELGPWACLPLHLIQQEYRVRHFWGDRPGRAEFLTRFAGYGPRLTEALTEVDAELAAEGTQRPSPEGDGPGAAIPPPTRWTCPDCRYVLATVPEPPPETLTCPACGSTFPIAGGTTAAERSETPPVTRLGRYELVECLGTGGFGSVWRARDTQLDREVAVQLPHSGQFAGRADTERFLREARATAQLQHPGIVALYDMGRDGPRPYLVADLVKGESLAQRLAVGRLDYREAADLLARVADALDYAHRHGVIHRDLKPSNIMLDAADGRPRIMDFGLAKREAGEPTVTREGQVLGTPAYMSPEQVRNPHAVDGRSDLYSLGVILYEMLTGDVPFRGVARMVLEQVQHDDPRPPRRLNDKIPRDLETVTLKCLAKEPERRYQSAADLAADLRRWLRGEPIAARPLGRLGRLRRWVRRRPALAGLVLVLSLTVAVGLPGVTWLWRRAEENFQEATRLKTDAQARAQAAEQQVREFRQFQELYFANYSAYQLSLGKNDRQAQREWLEAHRQYLERALQQHPEDVSNLVRLADIYAQLAELADGAASQSEALDSYQKACRLQERVIQNRPHDIPFQNALAGFYNNVGVRQRQLGLLADALASHERALALVTPLVAAHPEVTVFRSELARTYFCLGVIAQRTGQFTQYSAASLWIPSQPLLGVWYCSTTAALRFCEKSRDLFTAGVEAAPANVWYRNCLAEAWEIFGDSWLQLGNREAARAAYQETVRHQRLALARQPENYTFWASLLWHYTKLEEVQRDLGRPAEAVASLSELAKLRPDHPAYLFELACEVAKCVPLVGRHPGMLTPTEQVERDQYADLALDLLDRAVRHGYQDLAQLQDNPDLAVLRGRADFQKLLAEMEAKAKAAAK